MLLAAEPETSDPLVGPLRDHGFEIAVPGARADVVIAGPAAEVERLSAEAPVIVLGGADDAPVDRVLAFRRGCDDYVPPPFHHEELFERIRAVLRRRRTDPRVLYAGELRIDEISRIASLCGVALRLSHREFALLAILASEPTRVFTVPSCCAGCGSGRRPRRRGPWRRTPPACAASSGRSTPARPGSTTNGASGTA